MVAMSINKESLASIAYKKLLEFIQRDEVAIGYKLDAEKVLAEKMGISRAILREALQQLEYNGLISRKHGVGTFVSSKHSTLSSGLERLESMTSIISTQSYEIGTRFTSAGNVVDDTLIKQKLHITDGQLVEFIRVRTVNSEPFALDYIYMGLQYAKESLIDSLKGSIFDYFSKEFNLQIQSSACTLYAINIDEASAKMLEVATGKAVQVTEQVFYSSDNLPIFYGKSYLITDIIKFNLNRRK